MDNSLSFPLEYKGSNLLIFKDYLINSISSYSKRYNTNVVGFLSFISFMGKQDLTINYIKKNNFFDYLATIDNLVLTTDSANNDLIFTGNIKDKKVKIKFSLVTESRLRNLNILDSNGDIKSNFNSKLYNKKFGYLKYTNKVKNSKLEFSIKNDLVYFKGNLVTYIDSDYNLNVENLSFDYLKSIKPIFKPNFISNINKILSNKKNEILAHYKNRNFTVDDIIYNSIEIVNNNSYELNVTVFLSKNSNYNDTEPYYIKLSDFDLLKIFN